MNTLRKNVLLIWLIQNPMLLLVSLCAFMMFLLLFSHGSLYRVSIALGISTFILISHLLFAHARNLVKYRARSFKPLKDLESVSVTLKKQDGTLKTVFAHQLVNGDQIIVHPGETVPVDGTILEGTSQINECLVTGESSLVIRESGGDINSVMAGGVILSEPLLIEVSRPPSQTALLSMIQLTETTHQLYTQNEQVLNSIINWFSWLLCFSSLTYAFILPSRPGGIFFSLASLFCFLPLYIGVLSAPLQLSSLRWLLQQKIIIKNRESLEQASNIDTVIFDKTGTLTLGSRTAHAFIPSAAVSQDELLEASALASLYDQTSEGRSIMETLKQKGVHIEESEGLTAIEFSPTTRMSGVDGDGFSIRKGSLDSMLHWIRSKKGNFEPSLINETRNAARQGYTPLVVGNQERALGIILLQDSLKPGISDRIRRLKAMRIKSIMVTGDNPEIAAKIAQETELDDFVAEILPEDRLRLMKSLQLKGHQVAMSGDGQTDAPALTLADLSLAMNQGNQQAKDAAQMIDLDSDPTKIIDIIETGKRLNITRGALTLLSFSTSFSKMLILIPLLNGFNFFNLHSFSSALFSTVLFTLFSPFIVSNLAFNGIPFSPEPAGSLLHRNLLIYGLGGICAPILLIKLLDLCLVQLIPGGFF